MDKRPADVAGGEERKRRLKAQNLKLKIGLSKIKRPQQRREVIKMSRQWKV